MRPCLVVLAAGESRRLGACKALVDLGGRTPLERLLAAGSGLEGTPLVVTGSDHAAIAAAAGGSAQVVFNPRWSEGRSTGVLMAARLRPGLDLCVAPVDVPLVPRSVFEALAQNWEKSGSPSLGWLAPWTGDAGSERFGHPVVVGAGLAMLLERLPPGAPLSHLRRFCAPRLGTRVPDAEILDDLDLPDDLERLRRRLERPGGTQVWGNGGR